MKLLKKLFLVTTLFSIASCSAKANEDNAGDNGGNSSLQTEDKSYGTILKKIADDMFDYGGAVRQNSTRSRIRRAYEPVDETHRGPEIQLPAVLVYLTGVVSEIQNVDPINKAFEFTSTYEFDYSSTDTPNWTEQTIGLIINAKIDKANNKVFFSGLENVEMNGSVMANSYIFMDISYNFETKVLGDLKMYQDQNSSIYYFEVVNGQAYKIGNETTETERNAITETYNSYVTSFNTLCQTKVVAEGEVLRASEEAFVSTQKYANGLFGQKVDSVRIKQAS